MTARATILDGIRRSLRRDRLAPADRDALARRLAEPRPVLVPERGRGTPAELVERFAAMAVETQASLDRIGSVAEVPPAVARFLAEAGLPPAVVVSPDLAEADWAGAGLAVHAGAARPADLVSVTPCFRAVAETGTMVVASSPGRPTTLHFLPDIHVVVVEASRVVGSYEDAWRDLRGAGAWPRTVTWITGPSRTADIEQSLLLGAHGPRRLHVVLVDGA